MHEDLWRVTSMCAYFSWTPAVIAFITRKQGFFFPSGINCKGQRAEFVIVMQKKLEYNPTARCRER